MNRQAATMAIRFVLTIGVAAIFAATAWMVLSGRVTSAQALRDAVMIIIGSVIAQFGNAMSFWLGTSQGSADKDTSAPAARAQPKGKQP